MTLLQLIQKVCKRISLDAPNTAVGSTDDNIIRLIELANEEGDELSQRHSWQILTQEETHTTLAAESQGLMTTICGTDFDYIKNETFWNRTANRRWHPVDDVTWQQMKSSNITGPLEYFRIRGGYLIVLPTPTAGQTLAFEWVSKNWCETSGGTGQDAWAADTDVLRLSSKIMTQGLVWRWKKAQGLEYAEDFRIYEMMVANAMIRDGAKHTIHFSGGRKNGSNVPEGSWSL